MQLELPEPQPDGLVTPPVKPHTRDKHHWLRRYMHAFTTSMRERYELHYVDLFAGAGIEKIENEGFEWGSPLIAAQMPDRFTQLHLCEKDGENYRALVTRLTRYPQPSAPQHINDDANLCCDSVIQSIPSRGTLTLAFLDPFNLQIEMRTISKLTARRIDLVIFFPDYLDALRNWRAYYAGQESSVLDRFMGQAGWREQLDAVADQRKSDVLWKMYKDSLAHLGFHCGDPIRISSGAGPFLYRLVFASRHPFALDLWRRVTQKDRSGQYGFEF
jgi:three-Cys-motif partner protein